MPRPRCTACGGSTSTPRNFLLVCTCGDAWHHRCANPPVGQRALLAMIAATNRGMGAGSVAAWQCAACAAGGRDRGVGASTSGGAEMRRATERVRPRRRNQDRPVALPPLRTPQPTSVWPPVRRKKRKQNTPDSLETTPQETITVTRRPPSQMPRHVHIQTPESPKHASRAARQPYPNPRLIRRVTPQKPPPAPRQPSPTRTQSPPWRVPSPVPFTHPHSPQHEAMYQTPRRQRPRFHSPTRSPSPAMPAPPAHAATPPPSISPLPQIDLRRALRRKHSAILRRSAGSRQEDGPHPKRRKTEEGPSNAQVQDEADSRSEDVIAVEQSAMLPSSPLIPSEHVPRRSLSSEEDPAPASRPVEESPPTRQDEASEPRPPTWLGSDPTTAIEIDPTDDGAPPQPEASAELELNLSVEVGSTEEHGVLLPEASPEPEPKPVDDPPLGELSLPQPRASPEPQPGREPEPEPEPEPRLTNDVGATEPTTNPRSTVSTEPERDSEPITPKEVEMTKPSVRPDPMLPEDAHVVEDDHDDVDADYEGQDDLRKKCTSNFECSPDGEPAEITEGTLIAGNQENQTAEASTKPESEPTLQAMSEMKPTDQDLLPQQKASVERETDCISVPEASPRAQSLVPQNEPLPVLEPTLVQEVAPTKENATPKTSTETLESPKLARPDLEAISVPEVAPEDKILTPARTTESQAPDPEITPRLVDPVLEPTDCSRMHSPLPPEASLPTPRSRSPRERKSETAPVKAQQPVPSKVRAPVLARWFKEIATGPPRRRGREKVVAKMRGELEGGAEWSFVAR